MNSNKNSTTLPTIVVTAEHKSAAVVFWAHEKVSTTVGFTRAGGFLPRYTFPTAVLGHNGELVRITADPLPSAQVLRDAQESLLALQPKQMATLAQVDALVAEGDVVAIDRSASMDAALVEQWANHFAQRGLEVLLFTLDVTPYRPGDGVDQLAPAGGGSFDFLVKWVEDLPSSPAHVFVLTDGYVPVPTVAHPAQWTWMITPGGAWSYDVRGSQVLWTC